jgi:hypothetical protein
MRQLPGSRHQIKRSRVAVLSGLLVLATAIVFLHDATAEAKGARDLVLVGDPWVGLAGAMSLLIGTLSLHLARLQWGAGMYPLISYMRRRRADSEFALDVTEGKLWCIEVTNMGGVAIIDHVRYDIEIEGQPGTRRDDVDYEEMLQVLESSTGFVDESDFVFVNWQGGFGIPPEKVTRLCEFPMPVVRRVKRLDAHVFYQSRYGGLYEHLVSVIPARGLPREPGE